MECVEALRRARLDQEAGRTAAARALLEEALDLGGCELPALAELLRGAPLDGAADGALAGLRARFASRVSDPAVELPPGLLAYLATQPSSPESDDSLLAALAARRERGEAAGSGGAAAVELARAMLRLEERRGRREAMLATLERLERLDGGSEWAWRALQIELALERWEAATRRLDKLTAGDAPDPFFLRLHVAALAHLGRYDLMLRQLDRLLVAHAAAAEADRWPLLPLLLDCGWALRDAGRDAEAEAIFRRALEHDEGGDAVGPILLHLYASAEERFAQAAAVEERRRLEDDPRTLFEEGSQLLAAGDAANALDLLARAAPALVGGPYSEPAWYNLGLAAVRTQNWAQAAAAFEQAARLNGERAETHYQLGMARYQAGECAGAIAPLRRALEMAPAKNELRYYLATCLESTGETEEAARHWAAYRRAKASN